MSTLYAIGKDVIGTQYSPNPNSNSVSVVADGTKTYATLLNELYALIDFSKVTRNTFVISTWGTTEYKFEVETIGASNLVLTKSRTTNGNTYVETYTIANNSSSYIATTITNSGATSSDKSTNVVPSGYGIKFTLYYNDQPSYTTSMLADNVKYDNTTSGLSATETQAAIDELSTIKDIDSLVTKSSSYTFTPYKFSQYGKIVVLSFQVTANTNFAANTLNQVATLDSSIRPSTNRFSCFICSDSSGAPITSANCLLFTDGKLCIVPISQCRIAAGTIIYSLD